MPNIPKRKVVPDMSRLPAPILRIPCTIPFVPKGSSSARGTLMRHPHFTKHIEIRFAKRRIPGDTHVLCLADKTRIEEDASSDSAPVEINEESYGTARIPVALVDAAFGEVFATGHVTAHPVDPAKFEALKRMRALRTDLK